MASEQPVTVQSPRRTGETERTAHGAEARWLGGGTSGNAQLTATVGIVLIGLLAVIGITILRIQQLISIHLFVGFLLIGPVLLKLASTGYRFARYYTRNPAYREKGPPELALRVIAPVLVLSTLIVFVSGILLMFAGPRHRDVLLPLHKVSFIVWILFTGLHVLGHLPGIGGALRATAPERAWVASSPGSTGRWLSLAGALVGGLVLAILLVPHFGAWTTAGALHHDGH